MTWCDAYYIPWAYHEKGRLRLGRVSAVRVQCGAGSVGGVGGVYDLFSTLVSSCFLERSTTSRNRVPNSLIELSLAAPQP